MHWYVLISDDVWPLFCRNMLWMVPWQSLAVLSGSLSCSWVYWAPDASKQALSWCEPTGIHVHSATYKYIPVHTGTYYYVLVCTSTYWYLLVFTTLFRCLGLGYVHYTIVAVQPYPYSITDEIDYVPFAVCLYAHPQLFFNLSPTG